MKRAVYFFLCFIPFVVYAQLPDAWHGLWKGKLEMNPGIKGYNNTIMSLDIKRIDSTRSTFIITYQAEGRPEDKREYEIKSMDKRQFHFVTDEKNSILIDDYLIANKLISKFEVQGTWLVSSYELKDNTIVFEIVSGKADSPATSGSSKSNGEEIPAVNSYQIYSWQRAVLTKVK